MGALVATRMETYGGTQEVALQTVGAQLTGAGLDLAAGVVSNYVAATEITLPMTAGVGVSVRPGPWAVSAEVEWRQWPEAEHTTPFRLTRGDNVNINILMNGPEPPPPPPVKETKPPPAPTPQEAQ